MNPLSLIPWQAWALAAVLGLAGVYHYRATNAAYERGKADTINDARIDAGKRIMTMEKENATFRTLPARERCLAFMRDSGLPAKHCD